MLARSLTCFALAAAAAAAAAAATDEKYRVACFRAEDDSMPGCRVAQMYCCGPFSGVALADGVCSYAEAGAAKKCTPCRTDLDAAAVPACEEVQTPWLVELEYPDAQVVTFTDRTRTSRVRPSSGGVVSFSGAVAAPPSPFATTPSSGVTLTLGTFVGMEGWLDIPRSRFVRFPDSLLGLTATVPSYYTAEQFSIVYSCNSRGLLTGLPNGFKGCDIFLFQYHCPPCVVADGDLRMTLLGLSYPVWYPLSCGPVFKLVDDDSLVEHPFTTFIAEIADGERTQIRLSAAVEFMFWALSGKSVMCRDLPTETDCAAFPTNCEWSDDVCKPQACPRTTPSSGPIFPRCQVCTDDEAQFVPTVVFP
ncbi:hypothetical protein DIPPA_03359 [Diplonema papillatum]|nr:hypothetical protein DIPPA_03359 [Diplonema papillatum]